MKQNHKYVGLDVHKERNEVALAESSGEMRLYGSIWLGRAHSLGLRPTQARCRLARLPAARLQRPARAGEFCFASF